MSERPALSSMQAWMYAAVTHPLGVAAAVPRPRDIEAMVTPSLTLTSEQRLSIYHRSYYARLLECMESMFPALRHAIGVELFRQFAVGYLQANAPESYTLNRLADRFPAYLQATRPAAAPSGERETWPDFLIELAELELGLVQVFDGPGVERKRIAGVPEVLAIQAERLIPTLAPCLRLFSFQYPVHQYWNSWQLEEAPELPDPKPCFVLLTRRDYRVGTLELSLPQYEVLQRLDGASSLGSLAKTMLGLDASGLGVWVAEWASRGLVLSVTEAPQE
jgi:hypothetical protein